ncbi:MAG TPA: flagellar brake domain-containing protein [Syntrophomonadaceae bacterium]|nr:flagellar brake domain-containing protein [Syntrophomonadaceae bacterium]
MTSDKLKVNQLIEIEIELALEKTLNLPSRIEGIEEDYLYISVPMYRGEIVPLRTGQALKIYLSEQDVTYAFYTKVLGRRWQNIPLLVIQKPDNFIKIQRRSFMRLPIKLDVYFRASGDEADFQKGETVDISGGGALFLTEEPVEEGQILEVELCLPNRKPFFCRAKVIRILEKARKRGDKNKVAVEYYEILEGKRDKIVNFIFEKQREWIRKGLFQ